MSSVLQVENINVYYGSIHAVKDVSFHVEQGEVVTLIGANGAGKSTTLNTVAGLLHSRTGSVRFMGEELRHVPSHKLVGRGMALVPEVSTAGTRRRTEQPWLHVRKRSWRKTGLRGGDEMVPGSRRSGFCLR